MVSFVLGYLIIFGRAFKQQESHVSIALALPKVILTSGAVKIDDKTYLTQNNNSFFKEMERQGFQHKEQLGAGYVFEKNSETFMSIRRMYSSYFMIFSQPIKINK